MGKNYVADISGIAIVDGVLTGVTITDNFSSRNDTTKEDRKLDNVTFTLDGMDVATMISILWDGIKVKAQARSFKKMSNADFNALDKGTHDINDHLAIADRTSSKASIVNKLQADMMKKFFDLALEKAVDELGADATTEDYSAWATDYYNTEYKAIVDSMA